MLFGSWAYYTSWCLLFPFFADVIPSFNDIQISRRFLQLSFHVQPATRHTNYRFAVVEKISLENTLETYGDKFFFWNICIRVLYFLCAIQSRNIKIWAQKFFSILNTSIMWFFLVSLLMHMWFWILSALTYKRYLTLFRVLS